MQQVKNTMQQNSYNGNSTNHNRPTLCTTKLKHIKWLSESINLLKVNKLQYNNKNK